MSNALKTGSIDFGDLKSGGSSAFGAGSPGYNRLNEKAAGGESSPRTPERKSDKKKETNKAI